MNLHAKKNVPKKRLKKKTLVKNVKNKTTKNEKKALVKNVKNKTIKKGTRLEEIRVTPFAAPRYYVPGIVECFRRVRE